MPPCNEGGRLTSRLLQDAGAPTDAAISGAEDLGPFLPAEEAALAIDRLLHAWQARGTFGISPAALALAYADWGLHLGNAPGKQADLVRKYVRKLTKLLHWALHAQYDGSTPPAIAALEHDNRFRAKDWQAFPFALLYQNFLFCQQWWHNATSNIRGMDPRHEEIVRFTTRQVLDAFAPSNLPWTNPEVLRATADQGGRNLIRGLQNLYEDGERLLLDQPPRGVEDFEPGRNVAITPGAVIYRNRLIELIQYSPSTAEVHAEPVLIIPAWIMKYYILDLSPENSMVKYLVDRGHTVFMVSWKNPNVGERDLGMDDYLALGVLASLQAVRSVLPDRKVHAVGYCLGGTLLAIAAALLSREGTDVLQTLTLLAAQTDFTEAGELMLFINPSQVAYLEDVMWNQGYLDTRQMSGAFQMLRSNDLIWSSHIRQYLLGEQAAKSDLMAWNADATRMPYRMHSEYLRHLFLNNDFAAGRYHVSPHCLGGGLATPRDIHLPVFAVATSSDHIAPWQSVYKIGGLVDSDVTFVLTNGGHNAGIVSPPGRSGREFRADERKRDEPVPDPSVWFERAPLVAGSWWPHWQEYLARHSAPDLLPAREMGAPEKGYRNLGPAPGLYVRER